MSTLTKQNDLASGSVQSNYYNIYETAKKVATRVGRSVALKTQLAEPDFWQAYQDGKWWHTDKLNCIWDSLYLSDILNYQELGIGYVEFQDWIEWYKEYEDGRNEQLRDIFLDSFAFTLGAIYTITFDVDKKAIIKFRTNRNQYK